MQALSGLPKKQVARAFNRAVVQYNDAAVLQRQVADRLLQFFDFALLPHTIMEVGTGTGYVTECLKQCMPATILIGVDIAENMVTQTLQRMAVAPDFYAVCADVDNLPLVPHSVDLVIANLALQWCENLLTTFRECQRVLTPGGNLLFSTFGPNTLSELSSSWANVDQTIHVNKFAQVDVISHSLLQSNFELVQLEVQQLQLFYPDVITLMRQLKAWGAHNVNSDRARGLTGKEKLKRLILAYEYYRQQDLPASFEIIYVWARSTTDQNNSL